jgi:serine/threonine protein kinase/Tfp pilus assembly protein PilF
MEIFSEAATSHPSRRAAFLDDVCDGDAELRAEVESLLNVQENLSEFLESPTVDSGLGDLPDPSAENEFCEDRTLQIGCYTIVERIGEGGFGVVYRARQSQPIRREVALKIVKPGMGTRQIIARFESERQTLAMMDHPGIARIIDAGATDEGQPYFVMELVHGSPITEYCDAQKLTIAERLKLFIEVCRAVQHAHQKGIIHRDLKPSNILVSHRDGAHVMKVIDFGIAKAIESTACVGDHTEIRNFVGTPQYMSPEQAGACNGDIDTRSDIYSMGVLLYELLVGATPFNQNTLRHSSYDQVRKIIRESEPPTPSARLSARGVIRDRAATSRGLDGQKLWRTIRGELDWIVMRALEKDRQRRYETASALADDIGRYLAHEPLRAGPPSAVYRVRKFSRRYRGPLLAVTAISLALLAGLAGTIYGLVRAKQDRSRAEAALLEARKTSAFLSQMISSANPDQAKGSQLLVREVIEQAGHGLDNGALKEQPLAEAGIRMTLASAYDSLGQFAESEAQLHKAVAIRRRLLGNNDRLTAASISALGWAEAQRAEHEAGEADLREALAIQEKILGPRHIELVGTLDRLALALRGKRDTAGAVRELRRALEICRASAPASSTLASTATSLGVLLMDRGDYAEAEPLLHEALDLDRKLHGDRYRNVPRNLSNLAVIQMARGDLKAAEENWTKALDLQRAMLPADHPDIGWTLKLLGKLKARQGDMPGAEKYTREALAMELRIFGNQHPLVTDLMQDLGLMVLVQNRHDEAVALRREGYEMSAARERAALEANPQSVSHWGALADVNVRLGNFKDAADAYAQAARYDNPQARWLIMGAALNCLLGDDAEYRRLRAQLLDHFADVKDPDVAHRIAAICLLTDIDSQEAATIRKLANLNVNLDIVSATNPLPLAVGLVDYRLGNYEVSSKPLMYTRNGNKNTGPMAAAAGFYFSMALKKMDHANSPGVFADAAKMHAAVVTAEDGIDSDLEPWLICQIAHREAQAVQSAQFSQAAKSN